MSFHHCACAAHVQVTCVYYVSRFLHGYAVSCWLMFYFRPLLCSLVQWLKHSRKEYCELCKHRFAFTPSKYSGRWWIIRFNTTNAVKFPQQLIKQTSKHLASFLLKNARFCQLKAEIITLDNAWFFSVYSPDMPSRLPIQDICAGLLTSVGTAIRYWFHYTLVAFAWLGVVPLTACKYCRL